MSAPDIAALARSQGAAGLSWAQFTSDDAVQDYVCSHDDYEAHIESWRAAHHDGEVEYLASQGWVSRWTTAPTDYDCFGTTTAEQCGDWHGKPLRRVLCHPHHAGYQESRNGSGMHPTWDIDPRVEEREATERRERWQREDAERAARREAGLAWLSAASEVEIDAAEKRDEVESRGLKYTDLRDERNERKRRAEAAERAATWERCRASFEDGAVLVDDGSPSTRSTWSGSVIRGRDPHVYYACKVGYDHARDAEQAMVTACGEHVGSLAYVADWLASGRLRVVSASEVPPGPVTARIGHAYWKDILRVEVADRVVWVGRASGYGDLIVLDAAGKLARAKAVRDGAIEAYRARERAAYASTAR